MSLTSSSANTGGDAAVGGDDDCNSDIIDCIPLSATSKIVFMSFAEFSTLLIFCCCTASTTVAEGGSLELSGMIWNGGLRGIGGGVIGR